MSKTDFEKQIEEFALENSQGDPFWENAYKDGAHKAREILDPIIQAQREKIDNLHAHINEMLKDYEEAQEKIKELELFKLPHYLHDLVQNRNLVLEKQLAARLEKAEALLREINKTVTECWCSDWDVIDQYFEEIEK